MLLSDISRLEIYHFWIALKMCLLYNRFE